MTFPSVTDFESYLARLGRAMQGKQVKAGKHETIVLLCLQILAGCENLQSTESHLTTT
jgi:hypothetical protein